MYDVNYTLFAGLFFVRQHQNALKKIKTITTFYKNFQSQNLQSAFSDKIESTPYIPLKCSDCDSRSRSSAGEAHKMPTPNIAAKKRGTNRKPRDVSSGQKEAVNV